MMMVAKREIKTGLNCSINYFDFFGAQRLLHIYHLFKTNRVANYDKGEIKNKKLITKLKIVYER